MAQNPEDYVRQIRPEYDGKPPRPRQRITWPVAAVLIGFAAIGAASCLGLIALLTTG